MLIVYTWAVFGGKNSKEKVGFPSARDRASFSEICMATVEKMKKVEDEGTMERGEGSMNP